MMLIIGKYDLYHQKNKKSSGIYAEFRVEEIIFFKEYFT
jgi:hypothetical protein